MVTLEPLTAAKAMLLKEVRLRALQDTPSAFSSTYAAEAALTDDDWLMRAAQWSGTNSETYLAIDAALVCGIASGYLDKGDPSRAHLASMWVAPTHRRLGIGRLLVNAVIHWVRDRGVATLLLQVTSNNEGAIRFYQTLGFTMTGLTAPYRNDPSLLDREMRRIIS